MLNHAAWWASTGTATRSKPLQRGKEHRRAVGIKGVGLRAARERDDQSRHQSRQLAGGDVPVLRTHDANRDEFYRGIRDRRYPKLAERLALAQVRLRVQQSELPVAAVSTTPAAPSISPPAPPPFPANRSRRNIGNSFASFLLGQVDSANLGPVFIPDHEPLLRRGLHSGLLESHDRGSRSTSAFAGAATPPTTKPRTGSRTSIPPARSRRRAVPGRSRVHGHGQRAHRQAHYLPRQLERLGSDLRSRLPPHRTAS